MPLSGRLALVAIALATLTSVPARAQQQTVLATTRSAIVDPEPVRDTPSRSVGRPNSGRLRQGLQLRSGQDVIARGGSQGYGTAELVALVERAAARVRIEHPGPRLAVGDLSAANGGRIRPHRSHRSGRDADVGFFLHTEAGEPVEAPAFITLDRDGCGEREGQRYCWDHPRNWLLIASMAQDPEAQLQYVFVARDLRERLLNEGLRQGAPAELVHRVEVLTQPRSGSAAHRSHFHVRIYCPLDDRPGCVDEAPIHDWIVRPPVVAPPRRHARPHRRARRR